MCRRAIAKKGNNMFETKAIMQTDVITVKTQTTIYEARQLPISSAQNCCKSVAAVILEVSNKKATKHKCLTALMLANEADATRTRNLRIDSPML